MGKLISLMIALQIVLSAEPTAAASPSWKQPYEALDRQLSWGEYAVFYTREGTDTFPARKSRRPFREQYLKRLQAQINLANRVYTTELGLTPPLLMPLYANGRRINIHIAHQNKGMGAAGDSLVRYNYRHFGPSPRVLSITLASRWAPPNVTPQHEVFHLYQYAYSFFKTGWYLEGLARSMERFFTDKGSAVSWENLPMSGADLDDVMSRRYKANKMWNRLAMLCDSSCVVSKKSQNGAPVENPIAMTIIGGKTTQVCGGPIVRPLLEALNDQDDRAAKDRGLDPNKWPEREQRSSANNPYILAAIKTVLESSCPLKASSELRRFHALVTTRAKR